MKFFILNFWFLIINLAFSHYDFESLMSFAIFNIAWIVL